MEGYRVDLEGPGSWTPRGRRAASRQRGTVRISPEGRRLATVLGCLQPLRVRRAVPPQDDGWLEATFRIGSFEAAAIDVLSLSPHVEVLGPPRLRADVRSRLRRATERYRGDA
ncbi:MAG: WYL domain-containing protein [Candidatus Limnocylindrales bacterium]